MKTKALSILLLLVVVLGFSGVASAATQKVLVQEAYDEQVLVSEAYDEQVLVSEAWNETVFNHWLVNGEYTVKEVIHHEAVYETVHHEAVYKTIEVVDKEAWDEQVLVKEAYDEQVLVKEAYDEKIEANHFGTYLNPSNTQIKNVPRYDHTNYDANKFSIGFSAYGFVVVDHTGTGNNKQWEAIFTIVHHDAVYKTVHHEAVYKTVHHEAITHEEQVLVQEAYDEQVLVKEAYDETVYKQVPYFNNGPYFGGYPDLDQADVAAWADWIYSNGPNVVGGYGQWTPYFAVVFHDAVFETVHHEAVYKTVHHDAIYKDVEVPEPVTPEVKEPVSGVPMENTGMGMGALVVAVLLVLGGFVLARRFK